MTRNIVKNRRATNRVMLKPGSAAPGVLLSWLAALGLLQLPVASAAPAVSTTLYVDKYFEVRDNDAPIKYVWNGDTRIARITGSMSANLRVQRVRLYAGWNLISLAVTTTNFLTQIPDSASAAYLWLPEQTSWRAVADKETLPVGAVLWLNSPTNMEMSFLGVYTCPSEFSLPAGGAFVPSAGLEAWATSNLLCAGWAWAWQARNGSWRSVPAAGPAGFGSLPDFIAPGQAVYVQVSVPTRLSVPDPALRVSYYHADHLDSTSVLTDSAGQLVEETAYYPFGEPRNRFQPRGTREPYQFGQKERDAESGLQYFEARFLAGALGRFTRPDPVSAEQNPKRLTMPQTHNPYAYAANNPLLFHDPEGKDILIVVGRGATTRGDRMFHGVATRLRDALNQTGYRVAMGDLTTLRRGQDTERGALNLISRAAAGRRVTTVIYVGHATQMNDPDAANNESIVSIPQVSGMRLVQRNAGDPVALRRVAAAAHLVRQGSFIGLGCNFGSRTETQGLEGYRVYGTGRTVWFDPEGRNIGGGIRSDPGLVAPIRTPVDQFGAPLSVGGIVRQSERPVRQP